MLFQNTEGPDSKTNANKEFEQSWQYPSFDVEVCAAFWVYIQPQHLSFPLGPFPSQKRTNIDSLPTIWLDTLLSKHYLNSLKNTFKAYHLRQTTRYIETPIDSARQALAKWHSTLVVQRDWTPKDGVLMEAFREVTSSRKPPRSFSSFSFTKLKLTLPSWNFHITFFHLLPCTRVSHVLSPY